MKPVRLNGDGLTPFISLVLGQDNGYECLSFREAINCFFSEPILNNASV